MAFKRYLHIVLLVFFGVGSFTGGFLACKKKKKDDPPTTAASPALTLSSPSACGQIVSGDGVSLAATVSNAPSGASVFFDVNGVNVGYDDTSPYEVGFNASNKTGGSYALTARLVDANGNSLATSPSCTVLFAKRVFTTAAHTASGNLGGLSGADTLCQNAANAVLGIGLGGTWKAWLSDSTTDAKDRMADVGPWRHPDRVTEVFAKKAALAVDPANAIMKTENSTDLSPLSHPVWTGTLFGGTKDSGNLCSDWSSTSGDARIGDSASDGPTWTQSGTTPCSGTAHLYCFEQ